MTQQCVDFDHPDGQTMQEEAATCSMLIESHRLIRQTPTITDLPSLLIDMLLAESSSFLSDMLESESTQPGAQSERFLAESESAKGSIVSGGSCNVISSTIPVDEIVIATHISLLLRTLSDSEEMARSWASDGGSAGGRVSSEEALVDPNSGIVSQLPGKTWWLPCRILKAYISLQHEVRNIIALYFSHS
jgi:hypothetical protein